jgi:hypothetical protein
MYLTDLISQIFNLTFYNKETNTPNIYWLDC